MTFSIDLPPGFAVGHFTDREGWTGCTVVLAPEGSVASGEVRGGGPGTRETDLLSPASSPPGAQAVLLTGGSAFGLAAADGVVRHLAADGVGHPTPAGPVPLVPAAVVYDLALGSADARPGPDDGAAACAAAGPAVQRGSVGAGTGATVGKLLGPERWTKGGLGYAAVDLEGVTLGALAVVNPFGDVLAEDGTVAAGVRGDGRYRRTVDLVRAGAGPRRPAREATTLVCLVTDASMTKTHAWMVARAAGAGVARAVDPSGTAVDGDAVFCLAGGAGGLAGSEGTPPREVDPFALSALAAHVTAAAIRDGVAQATGGAGCPAASEWSG